MTEPQRVKPLAAAEASVRKFLLMVGFGFAAFIGGSTLAVNLAGRVASRLEGSGTTTRFIAGFLIEGAWVMIALPAIAWLGARVIELRPFATGIVGAGTGLMFQLALQYVSSGEEGLTAEPARQLSRLVAAAIGIIATAVAVRRGRELARVADEQAKLEAEKKKTQYDEFVRQAEALADRREQVPISPATPPADAAQAVPAAPPAETDPKPS